MIFKSKGDVQKVIIAFVITTGISLVLVVGLLLLTNLYPSRPYTSDSFVVLWFFGFLAIIFGLIAGTYQYNKLKKESGVYSEKKLSDEDDFKNQVENYHSLGITKSVRGQLAVFFLVMLVVSLLIGYFSVSYFSFEDVLYSFIIYIPLAYFIYKGHRWAMIVMIIMWTLEKGYQLVATTPVGRLGILTLVWWYIVVAYLYKAIKIENARRKKEREDIEKKSENIQPAYADIIASEDNHFCPSCGKEVNYKGSFCKFCGNKMN